MIVTLEDHADRQSVQSALVELGLWVRALHNNAGHSRTHYVVDGGSRSVDAADLLAIPGVCEVAVEDPRYPLTAAHPELVEVNGVQIGRGAAPILLAGPCSVESEEQIHASATRLAQLGVSFLRGGAFKTRTSPSAFQGHGTRALGWLRDAADRCGMGVVTEAVGLTELPAVVEVADLIQIGSRNMHNTPLLKAVGATGKPVLLKRGMSATVDEWLHAGEYCLSHGSGIVIFCERGIRSFDSSTRNVLDLGAAALLAHVHRLPVIVDPSHATGRRDLIAPLCRAALASGAAGLMLETHEAPGSALSDGPQALHSEEMAAIAAELAQQIPCNFPLP